MKVSSRTVSNSALLVVAQFIIETEITGAQSEEFVYSLRLTRQFMLCLMQERLDELEEHKISTWKGLFRLLSLSGKFMLMLVLLFWGNVWTEIWVIDQ